MTTPAAFISHALNEAQRSLAYISGITQADRNPVTLARTLARRAMAQLAQLEIIVRRLLTLMALALELADLRPRAVKPAHRQADADAEPLSRKSAEVFRLTGKVSSVIGPDLFVQFPCTVGASAPSWRRPCLPASRPSRNFSLPPEGPCQTPCSRTRTPASGRRGPPHGPADAAVHRMRPGL